jgi:hypothetical protein
MNNDRPLTLPPAQKRLSHAKMDGENGIDLPPPLEVHEHTIGSDLPPPPEELVAPPEGSPRSAHKGPPTARKPPVAAPVPAPPTHPKTATLKTPSKTQLISSPNVGRRDKHGKEKSAFEDGSC